MRKDHCGIRELDHLICSDCYRYAGSSANKDLVRTWLMQWGFRYTCLLRKAQAHRRGPAYYWYRLRLLMASHKTGFQIGYGARIGTGLFLGHRGTIIVNEQASLGSNVNLSPGVVIGQENRGARRGAPVLGNRVWVGANAVIVGAVHIGNDVLIAPNAFVNRDVPDHSIALGNPVRIIARERATEGYCHHLVPPMESDDQYAVGEEDLR
ncbi:serine acetyltransferase [Bifidobacterium scaligerum]|uniref:Serine acetyltransferase n=2 Tax=Bifidobacterium scaligerum TaxID=2052656 RepID=A0A2M9HS61_9BIFI|nr:serine acetyltransferase [Bifidobacterium scaligerum]